MTKRNYRREYDQYHAKPEQKKNRAGRNKARRYALKSGRVNKGDNREIDHKTLIHVTIALRTYEFFLRKLTGVGNHETAYNY